MDAIENAARAGRLAQNAKAADSVREAVACRPCVLEPKYDGWRILFLVTDRGVRAFGRSGEEYTGRMPHAEAELLRLLPPGSCVDGEAVGFRPDGTQDWGAAQSRLSSHAGDADGRLTFVAFDLVAHGGLDARPLPLRQRRQVLEAALAGSAERYVRVTPQMEATDANYEALVSVGFEGGIAKALDAPYASGKKGAGWTKHKATHTADVVVTGFTPGNGQFEGLIGAVEFGQYAGGTLVPRGKSSGMTIPKRREISASKAAYLGRVMEVKYQTITPDGSLLFPRIVRFRDDKRAEDCAWADR